MTMIPKIVHYCWFGGRPKPPSVLRYIDNWRSLLPDYEIREWNERNFALEAWPYAKQAWEAGKYAFVSDVARLYALQEYGGVYLDTDVEIRRPLDALLENAVVLGFEEGHYVATSTILARPNSRLIRDFLATYRGRSFRGQDGALDQTTNVQNLTSMLVGSGLKRDGHAQEISWEGESILVLDRVALSPIDYPNGIDHSSDYTYTIHHFGQTWASPSGRIKALIRRSLIRLIGGERVRLLRSMASRPLNGRSKGQQ